MRKSFLLVLCAVCFYVPLSHAAPATPTPKKLPSSWKQSNGAKPLSFQSGLNDIPPCENAAVNLRPIWVKAGKEFKVRWQILAAISKIESGFGCNMGPSSAGAVGWTQFMPSTWDSWGMDADGDGIADPKNAVDAVYSTARYLRVNGAPASYQKAIFAYNHADWYVDDVLQTAKTFQSVSGAEFDDIAEFSEEGQALKARIDSSEARIKSSRVQERQLLRSVRTSQSQYQRVRKQAATAERSFTDAKKELNAATAQYIGLTDGLVRSDESPSTGDHNVLAYAADAGSQDAVLVYQSAGALLDQQGIALARLRTAAQENNQARARAQALVFKAEDVSRLRVQRLMEAQTTRAKRVKALKNLRQDKREFERAADQWAKKYQRQLDGQKLLDNPFTGGLDNMSLSTKMIAIARAELAWGVKEEPDGSNDSPDIARYRTAVSNNAGVGPWCAYFVSYVARKAGSPLGPKGIGYAAVDNMVSYAQSRQQYSADVSQAQPGDIIFFPQHVGLVVKVRDGNITTIEGNSSNAVVTRDNRQNGATGLWRLPSKDMSSKKVNKKKHSKKQTNKTRKRS